MRNASFKLTVFGCVISICCVGFASLYVVFDELNDCAWNVCLWQLSDPPAVGARFTLNKVNIGNLSWEEKVLSIQLVKCFVLLARFEILE